MSTAHDAGGTPIHPFEFFVCVCLFGKTGHHLSLTISRESQGQGP